MIDIIVTTGIIFSAVVLVLTVGLLAFIITTNWFDK